MYLSTIQNIIMIVAVRILHLRTNVHVAIQSMSTLFWIMCLAPLCSHYFKRYFTRTFRFICPLVVVCYSFGIVDYVHAGYHGAFFLLLLLICDFEEISNFIYACILFIIPVVCMSKMMYVVFAPVSIAYYWLFRKEMNRKKKCCIAEIGFFSFMEGFLSILLKHGVQSGHRLGTIQHVTLPTLINKILYYTVQTFGIQLRCGLSNDNQVLMNVCVAVLVMGIIAFTVWQISRKGSFCREAKFILVMLSLIMVQCAVITLTTPDWHADISWKKSVNRFFGIAGHHLNLRIAATVILLVFLWIILQYVKPHFECLKVHLNVIDHAVFQTLTLLVAVGATFFYINQHPGPKSYDLANPSRGGVADWKAYVSMLDSDAFCIRISAGEARGWFYRKNAFVKSVEIPRSASVDLSDTVELNGKSSIVFYAHKVNVTNQILDEYYYMSIYDKNGNLVSKMRQLNSDAERLHIAFYPQEGISEIGHVEFTYEDGSQAFVDDTLEIGYH